MVWNWPNSLGWLPIEPQVYVCSLIPGAVITSIPSCWSFHVDSGHRSHVCLHVCKATALPTDLSPHLWSSSFYTSSLLLWLISFCFLGSRSGLEWSFLSSWPCMQSRLDAGSFAFSWEAIERTPLEKMDSQWAQHIFTAIKNLPN